MEFNPEKFKCFVVKAGTNVLTGADGSLDRKAMERIVGEVASLRKKGKAVVLVTSGAIASGMAKLGIRHKPKEVSMQQACAAVGQSALMNAYDELFSKHGIVAAQILLTTDDFTLRERYLDMLRTIEELVRAGVVPVVNENDAVSHRELMKKEGGETVFDDNDELSALLASRLRADALIILTDVDGLYEKNPKKNGRGSPIGKVGRITPEMMLSAGKAGESGRGGMKSKLHAAKLATSSGIWVAIANGRKDGIMASALSGKEGTLFSPSESALSGKEQWLAFASSPEGAVEINERAVKPLAEKGASLLAVGVVSVRGNFEKGAIVGVDCNGERLARGKTNYSSSELKTIAGKKSAEIKRILGRSDEVIDRENMVLLRNGGENE